MSTASFRDFVTTKPFVVVGPGKKLFYAHGGLLAQVSPVLRSDVEGGMREERLETIEIQDLDGDIDDDTVMRFIEYAYTGDYTVPEPDIVQIPSDSQELKNAFTFNIPETSNGDGWPAQTKAKKNKKKRSSTLSETLSPPEEPVIPILDEPKAVPPEEKPLGPVLQSCGPDRRELWNSFRLRARTIIRSSWQPRDRNDEREDYTLVFLCHARLYKFADRYNCTGLMTLTLQKLHLTLSKYHVYRERTSDVVELIRYTYAHTMDRTFRRDKLRDLVLKFAVCYIRELAPCKSFLKLLEEGGSFPADFMGEAAELIP